VADTFSIRDLFGDQMALALAALATVVYGVVLLRYVTGHWGLQLRSLVEVSKKVPVRS